MSQSITILTGQKQSGKTTQLLNYCNGKQNIAGILTPIINNKRCFYNISIKAYFDMEFADINNDIALPVGKYIFSENAFNNANFVLQNIDYSNITLIIVDEIGPLELQQKGLYSSVVKLLQTSKCNLLFVVREELVNNVIKYFKIKQYNVVEKI